MKEETEKKTCYKVAAALLALLALTILLSRVDMGPFNFPAALFIASAKAFLVVVFFMEIRSSSQAVRLGALAGLFWLLLLLGGVLADVATRPGGLPGS